MDAAVTQLENVNAKGIIGSRGGRAKGQLNRQARVGVITIMDRRGRAVSEQSVHRGVLEVK